MVISGINASDFIVNVQPGSSWIGPGGNSVQFEVIFNPASTGTRTAVISIANDDADENPYNFTIQGSGTGSPEIDVRFNDNGASIPDGDTTPSITKGTDFGNADVTSGFVSHWFRIWNDGTANLNLTGNPRVVISGMNASDFIVNAQPGSSWIGPGGNSVQFEVIFNPSGIAVRTATISIANDDSDDNPYNFDIQGTGTTTLPTPWVGSVSITSNKNVVAVGRPHIGS